MINLLPSRISVEKLSKYRSSLTSVQSLMFQNATLLISVASTNRPSISIAQLTRCVGNAQTALYCPSKIVTLYFDTIAIDPFDNSKIIFFFFESLRILRSIFND